MMRKVCRCEGLHRDEERRGNPTGGRDNRRKLTFRATLSSKVALARLRDGLLLDLVLLDHSERHARRVAAGVDDGTPNLTRLCKGIAWCSSSM
eukprot:6194835-Pleurochrysis_carterae.AAC.1